MAIKWGSTWVTAIKWGNTVCTKVKWGNTLVFPDGGYDGTTFAPPLNGGFTGDATITSGAINVSKEKTFYSSGNHTIIELKSANTSINFNLYSSLTVTFAVSCTSGGVTKNFGISAMNNSNETLWYSGDIDGNSNTTKTVTCNMSYYAGYTNRIGYIYLHYSGKTTKGNFSATCTLKITKLILS